MKKVLLALLIFSTLFANDIYGLTQKEKFQAFSAYFYKQLSKDARLPTLPNLSKGEFETKAMFNTRVKEAQASYNASLKNLAQQREVIQAKALGKAFGVVYGKPALGALTYDAEKQYFYTTITSTKGGFNHDIAIKVPLANAQNFKMLKDALHPQVVYDFSNDKLTLKEIRIKLQGNTFIATLDSSSFVSSDITVALNNHKKKQTSAKSFDDIPVLFERLTQAKQDNTKWLFVVGIENYDFTDEVKYSANSARMFTKVMQKAHGITAAKTKLLIDQQATSAKINYHLRDMLAHVKKGDTIYFYYSGHGVPLASQNNEPYILPQDVSIDYLDEYDKFKLQTIYKKLSDSKASKVVAIIDSCFSGGNDGKTLFKGLAAPRLKAKAVRFDKSKMVVLSAARDKQFANMYEGKKHRLFSYFIMKSIIEGKNSARDLYKAVRQEVKTKSYEFGTTKEQEPVYQGNVELKL